MKIVHLSTSDLDGGAAKAAYRIHRGLIDIGVDSTMLVRHKISQDSTVIANKTLLAQIGSKVDGQPLKRYQKREQAMFSPQWFPDSVVDRVKQINPDIVHLHWICDGFLKIESLRSFQQPIVWTLHDMWPLTGGCHYTKDCTRYTSNCGNCPVLNSSSPKDLSFRTLQRKITAWQNTNLTIVTPSRWLAQCAKASTLFKDRRIEVIANGIDTERFKPGYRQVARDVLKLPQDKNILLFVSGSTTGDPRKGFRYLVEALQLLQQQEKCNFELAILGEELPSEVLPWSFKTHYLGKFNDEVSLALVYNAVDLFIAPSVQDNLPNTVVEALTCGVPCIAFNIGGMPDMIDHMENGFLATPFDVDSLADGISKLISDSDLHYNLSANARSKAVNNFNIQKQSEAYIDLYRQVLKVA